MSGKDNPMKKASMKKKPITSYLTKKKDVVLVQGRVPAEIAMKAKVLMKKQGQNWTRLINAAVLKFIDEVK